MRRLMLLIGLLVVACVICVVVIAVASYFMEQERAEVREAYGEDVAVLCDPPGGGTANASNLPAAAEGGVQVLVLGQGDELKHDYHDSLPEELRADDSAELDVVACVAQQNETVESCPYYDLNDDTKLIGTINRVQKNINVILLNPEGNLRIAEFSVKGGDPQLCPDEVELRQGSTTTYEGSDVAYNDFEVALRGALGTE